MNKVTRQNSLDAQKYADSEQAKKDLSGHMDYCDFCEWQMNNGCDQSQEQREKDCSCAKAYTKMHKKKV